MSEDYVRSKIKEALKARDGDKLEAQKLLITWAVRDQPLLLGLAKPHLKTIIAERISAAVKKTGTSAADTGSSAGRPLGEKRAALVPPPKSSPRQASVMHQLAAAFKKKK